MTLFYIEVFVPARPETNTYISLLRRKHGRIKVTPCGISTQSRNAGGVMVRFRARRRGLRQLKRELKREFPLTRYVEVSETKPLVWDLIWSRGRR